LAEQAEQIRYDLAEAGIPKREKGKGFELFDTNTWIKGEKELQVLEMRALKGQLEKDLAAFEHVKSASVILDIPPQKSFNSSKFQTKASVILTLMPSARLTPSELRAITYHLAGAVRGLESHMIAISDTTGKLYKAIDPHNAEEPFHDANLLFEEHLEEKISAWLTHLVGEGHFYTTVQAVLNRETEEVVSLSVAVVIDKAILTNLDYPNLEEAHLQKEIEQQLTAVVKGYGPNVEPVVNFIYFDKQRKIAAEHKERGSLTALLFTLFFVAALLCTFILFFIRRRKGKEEEEESLFRMMTRVDLNTLAAAIQQEEPQTIALMLSYLEPKRAEQMIAALKGPLQEEVLFYLSELEKDDS
jgi:flagellar M-ring protein FliF